MSRGVSSVSNIVLDIDICCAFQKAEFDRIYPNPSPQKELKKLPVWDNRERKEYDAALRGLQRVLASQDEDGINMMHSILSQLKEASMPLIQDYKQVTCISTAFLTFAHTHCRRMPFNL